VPAAWCGTIVLRVPAESSTGAVDNTAIARVGFSREGRIRIPYASAGSGLHDGVLCSMCIDRTFCSGLPTKTGGEFLSFIYRHHGGQIFAENFSGWIYNASA
jgi:hypothetical protein